MNPVRPNNEPTTEELQALLNDEERSIAERPDVPDAVRGEIIDDIERRQDAEIEEER
jgi:hypothetical protein